MKEDLVSLETAKIAHQKGFNIPTAYAFINHYSEDYIGIREYTLQTYHQNVYNGDNPIYMAPTLSLLQKWLREIHDLHIHPKIYCDAEGEGRLYACDIYSPGADYIKVYRELKYEVSLDYALRRALKDLVKDA